MNGVRLQKYNEFGLGRQYRLGLHIMAFGQYQ